jgi:hypothetical protein
MALKESSICNNISISNTTWIYHWKTFLPYKHKFRLNFSCKKNLRLFASTGQELCEVLSLVGI